MNWLLFLVHVLFGKYHLGKQCVFFFLQSTDVDSRLLSWTTHLCQSNCFDEIHMNDPMASCTAMTSCRDSYH